MVCEHRKGQSAQCMEDTIWSEYFPGVLCVGHTFWKFTSLQSFFQNAPFNSAHSKIKDQLQADRKCSVHPRWPKKNKAWFLNETQDLPQWLAICFTHACSCRLKCENRFTPLLTKWDLTWSYHYLWIHLILSPSSQKSLRQSWAATSPQTTSIL